MKTGVGLGQPGEGMLGRAFIFTAWILSHGRTNRLLLFGQSRRLRKIGTEVLRRFTVVLDYPHNRIILEPNSHFKENFPDA